MFFDTHAHFDDSRFKHDRHELLRSMPKAGVSLIVNIGSNMKTSENSVELAKQYDFVYAAVGVHPHDSKELNETAIERLAELCHEKKVVAIGEIGLDFHYDHSPRDVQRQWFRRQIQLAKQLDKPIVVHDRESGLEALTILKEEGHYKGVLHCFSGSVEMAKLALSMGFYISIAGPVTYKNNVKTCEVVKFLPLDRILIETDCPYLAPEPHRGERNNSEYVRHVAEKVAQLTGLTLEQVAKQTMANGKKVFGIE